MATYALDLSDGSQVSVDAPIGATNAELLKLAKQQRREARKAAANERRDARADDLYGEMENIPRQAISQDDGLFTDLAKGFGAGFVGTGEMAALGAATLLDEETEVARDKIQGIADAINQRGRH